MRDDFVALTWRPIDDLPKDWDKVLTNAQSKEMAAVWREQASELRARNVYDDFLLKLKREWSIETGVIEGIYSIDASGTRTLIEKGLDAAFLTHGETDGEPESVVAKARDHFEAIEGLYTFVSGERKLSKSYIRELHDALTLHQETIDARDTQGNAVKRKLRRGQWKVMRNDVVHPDGRTFEFCPPEHVEHELDRMLEMHYSHQIESVPVDIQTAWLHHRFSIIHPFEDGNGRVARCLATLVLLRANWLPLVVTREDRVKYIASLRSADAGDLKPLVDQIGALQRKSIRQALSLSERVINESTAVSGILAAFKSKYSDRQKAEAGDRKRALDVADTLQHLANETLNGFAEEITNEISALNPHFSAKLGEGSRGSEREKYNYHQTIECAKKFGYFADLRVYRAWSSLNIEADRKVEILFAFHGVGKGSSGMLGCAAMVYPKDRDPQYGPRIGEVQPLGEEPFEFYHTEATGDVQRRFRQWLDERVIQGLAAWQELAS